MVLTYYYHLLSQPCRALYIFLKLNNIPFVEKPIALLKGEHRGEDFKKINQFKKVPVIDDDGFILTESVAILKYLTIKYKAADHWYPKDDPLVQARIDEYMNWQHTNTRTNAALFFQNLLLIPMMTQRPINVKKVEQYKGGTNDAVDGIETYFLRDNKYLCGNEITLADLLGVCELMQLCAVSEEKIWTSHATVKAWMERVRERLNPYFDEAHQIVFEFREKYKTLKPQFSKM